MYWYLAVHCLTMRLRYYTIFMLAEQTMILGAMGTTSEGAGKKAAKKGGAGGSGTGYDISRVSNMEPLEIELYSCSVRVDHLWPLYRNCTIGDPLVDPGSRAATLVPDVPVEPCS